MIDKINFYDLYGYVLPGFVLIALMWLPFSWLSGSWPSVDLDSAVAILILSYVVGFILQSVATDALSSKMMVATESDRTKKGERHPSDFILDADDKNLSKDFKTALATIIKDGLKLDVYSPTNASGTRADAFRACRAALISRKAAGYAEQAQGMYSLARGLFSAVALCVPFFVGWGMGAFRDGLMNRHCWGLLAGVSAALTWLVMIPWKDLASGKATTWRLIISVTITVALVLGGVFPFLAAALFTEEHRCAIWIALPFFAPVCLLLVERKRLESPIGKSSFALCLSIALGAIGFDCAGKTLVFDGAVRVFGAAMLAVLLLPILHHAYRRFALNFAMTVYRDFYSMAKLPAPASGDSKT